MLNFIASYNKLLYAIINTLYKITSTSMIPFGKLAILKIKVFQGIENFCTEFEYWICDVNYNFVSQCRNFCEVNYNFVSQCRNFWEVNYNFVGVPPVYTQFFELREFFWSR